MSVLAVTGMKAVKSEMEMLGCADMAGGEGKRYGEWLFECSLMMCSVLCDTANT